MWRGNFWISLDFCVDEIFIFQRDFNLANLDFQGKSSVWGKIKNNKQFQFVVVLV